MCVCTSECALHSAKASEKEMRGCSVPTGRWSLSLSLEVFHFTTHYTCLFLSACCLSFTVLQHPHHLLSSFCFMLSPLLTLSLCLPCWRHVKCQVQSQPTDLLWHVCGCKTSKGMSCYTHTHTSLTVAVCIGKAPACLLRGQQALRSLHGAVRVKSPQQRYLAALYNLLGLNLY